MNEANNRASELTLKDAARMALNAQRIGQIAAIATRMATAALVLQREVPGREVNTHPIMILFLWKLNNLANFDGSVSEAARRVMEIANVKEFPK